jgi:hypothetical protein
MITRFVRRKREPKEPPPAETPRAPRNYEPAPLARHTLSPADPPAEADKTD